MVGMQVENTIDAPSQERIVLDFDGGWNVTEILS